MDGAFLTLLVFGLAVSVWVAANRGDESKKPAANAVKKTALNLVMVLFTVLVRVLVRVAVFGEQESGLKMMPG